MQLPAARTADLIEQEAGNELLVYDLRINKAYSLNETSRNVFKACDGKKSFDDLKRKHAYPEDVIYFSLDELKKNNLIEGVYASPFVGMNRREIVRKIGLTSMIALPMICGLVAPTPVSAASNSSARTCQSSSDCDGGSTCVTVSGTPTCCTNNSATNAPGSSVFAGGVDCPDCLANAAATCCSGTATQDGCGLGPGSFRCTNTCT